MLHYADKLPLHLLRPMAYGASLCLLLYLMFTFMKTTPPASAKPISRDVSVHFVNTPVLHFDESAFAKPNPAARIPNASACRKLGGTWGRMGLHATGCELPTPDAGKACTDSSECVSLCDAQGPATIIPGKSGTCSSSYYNFGCRSLMINGEPSTTMCID